MSTEKISRELWIQAIENHGQKISSLHIDIWHKIGEHEESAEERQDTTKRELRELFRQYEELILKKRLDRKTNNNLSLEERVFIQGLEYNYCITANQVIALGILGEDDMKKTKEMYMIILSDYINNKLT